MITQNRCEDRTRSMWGHTASLWGPKESLWGHIYLLLLSHWIIFRHAIFVNVWWVIMKVTPGCCDRCILIWGHTQSFWGQIEVFWASQYVSIILGTLVIFRIEKEIVKYMQHYCEGVTKKLWGSPRVIVKVRQCQYKGKLPHCEDRESLLCLTYSLRMPYWVTVNIQMSHCEGFILIWGHTIILRANRNILNVRICHCE